MIITKKTILKSFLIPVFFLSFLSPRNKKVWVFGSTGYQFRDNSKYLFLYVVNNCPEITAVWISRNKTLVAKLKAEGYKAEYYMSLAGIKYLLKAYLYISEAGLAITNFWFSGGAMNVNLWHGIPIKKIGIGNKRFFFPKEKTLKNISEWFWFRVISIVERNPDFLLVTSQFYRSIMREAFAVEDKNIFICGQPRNDILVKDIPGSITQDIKSIINDIKTVETSKSILYMPTFRDSGGDTLKLSGLNLEALNKFLTEIDATLWIKFHPVEALRGSTNFNYTNIKKINGEIDPYPILNSIDLLVTDYSSICFDFALMNKPVVFYAFDLETFLNKHRDMYFDYKKIIPKFAKNQEQLQSLIQDGLSSTTNNFEEYKAFLDIGYDYKGFNSSKLIYEELIKRIS